MPAQTRELYKEMYRLIRERESALHRPEWSSRYTIVQALENHPMLGQLVMAAEISRMNFRLSDSLRNGIKARASVAQERGKRSVIAYGSASAFFKKQNGMVDCDPLWPEPQPGDYLLPEQPEEIEVGDEVELCLYAKLYGGSKVYAGTARGQVVTIWQGAHANKMPYGVRFFHTYIGQWSFGWFEAETLTLISKNAAI